MKFIKLIYYVPFCPYFSVKIIRRSWFFKLESNKPVIVIMFPINIFNLRLN